MTEVIEETDETEKTEEAEEIEETEQVEEAEEIDEVEMEEVEMEEVEIAESADAPPIERIVSAEPFTHLAADELTIQGTIHSAPTDRSLPGVLLLHMLNSNQQAWDQLVPQLTEAGYVVLTIDMRGHGTTGGNNDWTLAESDLIGVWQAFTNLPSVDKTRTAVIGGSIGSNMALITGKNIPEISTTILLSPGLDYRGVKTEDAAVSYGDRPLLIVASSEDSYSAQSSAELDIAASNSTLQLYDGAGHGTNMLGNEPTLTPLILDWLATTLS